MTEKRQTSQGLYYPHFTTFRNETSEYYYICDALSSCDEIFVQACLDQNFTQKGKGLLNLHVPGTQCGGKWSGGVSLSWLP
jgi:hypothetical protein